MLLRLFSALLAVASAALAFSLWGNKKSEFVMPQHADGVHVADHARHDLPPVIYGTRVAHLMSGMHFDNLLQDTPDELRPPSVILFDGFETCGEVDAKLGFTQLAEQDFPSRERLLVAKYDLDANPKRGWFRFTPEMDLAKRFGGAKCGDVFFVPRGEKCNGFTTWCSTPTSSPDVTRVGCADFKDPCAALIQKWDGKEPLLGWVKRLVSREGEPKISPVFGSYAEQRRWIVERDETTTDNEFRDYFLVESFPAFTNLGFLAMPIPDEFNSWILDFWNRRKHARTVEGWSAASTQMSFHEEPTTFVSLDQEGRVRDKFANEVIKPIVEKWSGISHLELTSFYGVREYKNNWLRGHIDRIDTHVLSVTFSLGKINSSNINELLTSEEEARQPAWPLEVIAFDGEIYRHSHPAGTMILYESSKLVHGRPYHNPGPHHLGAFCHFKPVSPDRKSAEKWDKIARDARANQARNTRRMPYVSAKTEEPRVPVFTAHRWGESTGWRSSRSKPLDGGFTVTFSNSHSSPLDIHWMAPKGNKVFQGTLAPGATMEIQTYVGHHFGWTESGKDELMPRGEFEIELGSRVYRYGGANGAQSYKSR